MFIFPIILLMYVHCSYASQIVTVEIQPSPSNKQPIAKNVMDYVSMCQKFWQEAETIWATFPTCYVEVHQENQTLASKECFYVTEHRLFQRIQQQYMDLYRQHYQSEADLIKLSSDAQAKAAFFIIQQKELEKKLKKSECCIIL